MTLAMMAVAKIVAQLTLSLLGFALVVVVAVVVVGVVLAIVAAGFFLTGAIARVARPYIARDS